ncbi:NAD(P)/FAD-dependent oxidoreductase [Nocardioides marmoribigeumensis]|uniref:NADPH-dependent 2,4-dienoyl-CoA reductase/sulfur reductase-like enzyme n=1 Tax=Nocardioides marmoribigeumensis TaxID=433649 RepID=A0ABU2BYV3_9ACTN|nr:FAD-dependent oxidoreductase [Nocardioides marmoribigeumensis]MDR7363572.1 NADPH-dependent 2,4-dienoyl-CoA reductase/sulfur reductase-like enzyme [Nocardioides marmoribigeumensis]
MSVVVVGAGIAGVSAVASLRAEGYAGPLGLVGDEPVLPYRRPTVSKGLVRGTQTLDQVLVKPEEWYAEQGVDLRRGVRVTAVVPGSREVVLDTGERLGWSRLVLATGGTARLLPGLDPSPLVHTLRTAADAERLTRALDDPSADRVVVVGAGLVGAEIAAGLHERGLEVVLLESAALPLPRLLPPALGEVYADLHRSRGVTLETGVDVAKVLDTGREVLLGSVDGRAWSAALVVVAVGLAPDLTLADSAGLDVGPDRAGVVVDHAGRTSVPGVWAAGDLTLRPSSYVEGVQRAEHWQAAQNHGTAVGRALAADLAGDPLPADFDEVPWAWSDQYSLNLQVTGWPDPADDLVLRGTPSGDEGAAWVAFFLRDGVLRGAVGVGRARDIRHARTLVGQRAVVDPALLADPDVAVPATVAT